ncbi:hypothetical protein LEP1GSC058_3667 [Leptospira fainei serovar Hurstbridge str. BUT 6]|uniref:DUF5683 domain-containing protein n=1 Tax=Leptospira fainei serovar Hurstbridge str. BUT 6 TaxID=1193011 RepID=S3UX86_9LEPT|nr:DUF5683 domain-containing protein [Leptospira fainei]EPG72964.1 hypothetical protein LEP1GSC058_3667 [Leptospira fainei serovar Hurstbridge str. BUT 6]
MNFNLSEGLFPGSPVRSMPLRWIIIFFLIIISSNAIFSATLTLKNGKVLQGKVVNQTRTDVQMEVGGKVLTIPKTEIQELRLKDEPKQEPKKVETPKTIEQAQVKEEPIQPGKQRWWQKPRWNYPLSSAVLPGWGLWKADKKWQGVVTFAAVLGLAYYSTKTNSEFHSAKAAYQNKVYEYLVISQNDSSLNQPSATLVRVLVGSAYSGGAFNHYRDASTHSNDALIAFGVAYGLQILYSYYLGVQKEKLLAGDPNPEGIRFSVSPTYRPFALGGNTLGWNSELAYAWKF